MIQKIIYLAVFLAGLALAVHVMLNGAGRWKRRRSAKPSAALNPPTVAALATGFGASGYLLTSRSALSPWSIFLIAAVIGVAALSGMIVLMAKWALRSPAPSDADEDDINGQVATVSRAISAEEPGEITWYAWEKMHVMPARITDQSDETEIPVGTEVVIDIVEDGFALVELWSVVEQRL
jgi:hypothetical protein